MPSSNLLARSILIAFTTSLIVSSASAVNFNDEQGATQVAESEEPSPPQHARQPGLFAQLVESRQARNFFTWIFETLTNMLFDRSDGGGSIFNPDFGMNFMESFFKAKEMAAPILVTLGTALWAFAG